MNAAHAGVVADNGPTRHAELEWAEITAAAPQLAATMRRYLTQAATFLATNSVTVADNGLRILARWLITTTDIVTVADIGRDDIEQFKIYLAARPGVRGGQSSPNTHRQRLRTLRVFFERIIEWDWPDAPARNPIGGFWRSSQQPVRWSVTVAC
jgi:hypothetical protein